MKDETVIITGSTSGIGKHMAGVFLELGAKVMISSRNQERVDSTLKLYKQYGDSVAGQVCDTTDIKSLEDLVESAVSKFGSVRILIANAGINTRYGPFDKMPLSMASEEIKKMLDVNLI